MKKTVLWFKMNEKIQSKKIFYREKNWILRTKFFSALPSKYVLIADWIWSSEFTFYHRMVSIRQSFLAHLKCSTIIHEQIWSLKRNRWMHTEIGPKEAWFVHYSLWLVSTYETCDLIMIQMHQQALQFIWFWSPHKDSVHPMFQWFAFFCCRKFDEKKLYFLNYWWKFFFCVARAGDGLRSFMSSESKKWS